MTNNILFKGKLLHLEITKKCPLSCSHCYNESGLAQPHGTVDWYSAIKQAAKIGFQGVQLIGGEPFVHPDIYGLTEYAVNLKLHVEIYSNLAIKVDFNRLNSDNVTLATSFYSANPQIHDAITGQFGSWNKTVSNIKAALQDGFSLRVGAVKFPSDEKISTMISFLENLGVSRRHIKIDKIREFGRASNAEPSISNLCGQCGKTAAILFDGTITSCPMARFLSYGNINNSTLAEVLFCKQAEEMRQQLAGRFRKPIAECSPSDPCIPDYCNPDVPCDPDVSCSPTSDCDPDFDDCNPDYCNPAVCAPDAN